MYNLLTQGAGWQQPFSKPNTPFLCFPWLRSGITGTRKPQGATHFLHLLHPQLPKSSNTGRKNSCPINSFYYLSTAFSNNFDWGHTQTKKIVAYRSLLLKFGYHMQWKVHWSCHFATMIPSIILLHEKGNTDSPWGSGFHWFTLMEAEPPQKLQDSFSSHVPASPWLVLLKPMATWFPLHNTGRELSPSQSNILSAYSLQWVEKDLTV